MMLKSLFSLFLSFLTLTSHAQNSLLGDLNRDGQVNVSDATMIIDIILNGYAPFSVNPTEVTLSVNATVTVNIVGGYNLYEVISPNPNVVKASLNGNTITLTAVSSGETTVIVRDVHTFRNIGIPVNVTGNIAPPAYLTCPDDDHPHLIDLGLPSGTKWACCNVDTDHPENQNPTNYGSYYAWGETETKSRYDYSTYTHCDGTKDTCHDLGSDISGTVYDVAHVKWGGTFHMPTYDQYIELLNNCNLYWNKKDGVNGCTFWSKINGASVFMPESGFYNGDLLEVINNIGDYWLSTQKTPGSSNAYYFRFYMDTIHWYDGSRSVGHSVRPVAGN